MSSLLLNAHAWQHSSLWFRSSGCRKAGNYVKAVQAWIENNIFDPNSTAVDINTCICMHMRWRDTQVYKYKSLQSFADVLYIWHTQCTTVRHLFCERSVYIFVCTCLHYVYKYIQYIVVYSIHTNYYIPVSVLKQTEVARPSLRSSSLLLDRECLSFEPGAPGDCCERGPAIKGGVSSQVRRGSTSR